MSQNPWLKRYSIFVAFSVLLLILKGALVTSNDAGLAVPDWPNSFGENMFLFPPSKWTGIIFYEHVHRLIASAVGLFTLILAVWLFFAEERRWVKALAICALLAVILQGVLGGLTVLYLLPVSISSAHAVLAQSFFIMMIVLAYSQTAEGSAIKSRADFINRPVLYFALFFIAFIFIQLIIGAVMRHSYSGLAVPDFPTMGGEWIPAFDRKFYNSVNEIRRSLGLSTVSTAQVSIHLLHRLFAVFAVLSFIPLFIAGLREKSVRSLTIAAGVILILQFALGVATLLSLREAWTASFHVMFGAALLGLAVIITMRAAFFPYQNKARES